MAQPSKILYLITQSELGGASRYVFDLAVELKNSGYQVAVAAGGNGELFQKLQKAGIEVYPLKNLVREINPLKDLKAYFEIKKLLKKIQPDILHLNSTKAGVIGSPAGKRTGVKKIIYTAHGFVFNEPLPSWRKALYRLAEKISAKSKDKIICVSEFDRRTGLANKIAPAAKLITINNGVSDTEFLPAIKARAELKLPNDKIIVGTVANFYATKGLIYLIPAAKAVLTQYPNLIFVVLGEGQLRAQLEKEIDRLGLNNNFLLLGRKIDPQRYLLAFNLYVCSSVKEGFPYSLLEAMQAGLPIVSTNVGGIAEMIQDQINGLLVKPADPAALAKSLVEILENKNLASRLAKQAKIDVTKKFHLVKMAAETKRVYQAS